MELDVEEYKKGVEELMFSVIGRNYLQKGKAAPTTIELRAKLAATWGMESFKLIPIGGGMSHILLKSMEEQSLILSHGLTNLPCGIFRVVQW